jgi:hypothetical protein
MNLMDDEEDKGYLMEGDYEEYIEIYGQGDEMGPEEDDSIAQTYRLFSEALQAELHHKYDLRPRGKGGEPSAKTADAKKKGKAP